MGKQLSVPGLGENIEHATVVGLRVGPGDAVKEDTTVLEVEAGKATVEVPAGAAGTIEQILVAEGDEVDVGQVFAVLALGPADAGDPGEMPAKVFDAVHHRWFCRYTHTRPDAPGELPVVSEDLAAHDTWDVYPSPAPGPGPRPILCRSLPGRPLRAFLNGFLRFRHILYPCHFPFRPLLTAICAISTDMSRVCLALAIWIKEINPRLTIRKSPSAAP